MAAGGRDEITLALLSMPRLTAEAYLSALPVVMKQRQRDEIYQAYTAETVRLIGENEARKTGGGYMKLRYTELINPKPEDTRTGSEIVSHMKEKLREIGGAAD